MAGPKKPETKSTATGLELLVFILLLTAIIPVIAGFFAFTFNPLKFLSEVRAYFAPFFERYLFWLEASAVIFSALFLWGIIYIFIKTNYLEIKREQFLDILGKPYVSRRRSLKGWKQIQSRLQSQEQNQWKLAILEADHILNEILKMSGYLGAKLEDKLELITPAQLSNVEEVKKVHQIRHKIASDPGFLITNEEAREIIDIYKKSFIELNLIQD
ncbi:MAG: hypothetical protein HYY86_02525 [Candidatus Harrisonbacteria bacterium]|nr:hypothetical protein [Candidatus Harrisonbacteria bacterium]